MVEKLTKEQAIDWLVSDLEQNGPVLLSAFAWQRFFPPDKRLLKWLLSLPKVIVKSSGYCVASSHSNDMRSVRRVWRVPYVDWSCDATTPPCRVSSDAPASRQIDATVSSDAELRVSLIHAFSIKKFAEKNAFNRSKVKAEFANCTGVTVEEFLRAESPVFSRWSCFKKYFRSTKNPDPCGRGRLVPMVPINLNSSVGLPADAAFAA